ncbi:MAG: M56 family metallopeptidase [Planctomycetaceae bacterium]
MSGLFDGLMRAGETWRLWVVPAASQAAIVGLLVLAVTRLARRRPAPFRYWLLLLALTKFVMPPTAALPTGIFSHSGSQWPVAWSSTDPVPANQPVERLANHTIASESPRGEELEKSWGEGASDEMRTSSSTESHGDSSDFAPVARLQDSKEPSLTAAGTRLGTVQQPAVLPVSWPVTGMLLHALGSGLVIAWTAFHFRRLRRLLAAASPAVPDAQSELDHLSREMGLRRTVRLLESTSAAVPFSTGVRSPAIVLPAGLRQQLAPECYCAVLQHELAHHRRGDLLVNWLQLAIGSLWWFHPILWLVNRELRSVREECCDDLLLLQRVTSENYCRTLLEVARAASVKRTGQSLVTVGMAQPQHALAGRLSRIMDGGLARSDRVRGFGVTTIAILAALLLPGMRSERSGPQVAAGAEPEANVATVSVSTAAEPSKPAPSCDR